MKNLVDLKIRLERNTGRVESMFALLGGACAADHVRRKVAGRGQRASGGAESAAADGSVSVFVIVPTAVL